MALQREQFAGVDFGRAGSAVAEIEYDDVSPFPITAVEVIGTITGAGFSLVMTNFAIDADRGREITFKDRVIGTKRRALTRTEQEEWRFTEVRDNGGTDIKRTNDLRVALTVDPLNR